MELEGSLTVRDTTTLLTVFKTVAFVRSATLPDAESSRGLRSPVPRLPARSRGLRLDPPGVPLVREVGEERVLPAPPSRRLARASRCPRRSRLPVQHRAQGRRNGRRL